MELGESTILTSDYSTKLQSSRQYGTGTKTEIQFHRTRYKAKRKTYTFMGTFSLTEETKIYNEEKTAYSISGARKTVKQ